MRAIGVCVIHAIAMMGVLWAARGGESPAAKPLVLHARLRTAAPAQGAGSAFTVKEKTLEWEPAKTALIICDMWDQHWCKGAIAPGRRAGAGDEPRGSGGPRSGRAHHPRAEQLHGRLQESPGSQTRTGGPEGRQSARRYRRLVHQDPGGRTWHLPDRPDGRRMRRWAAVPGRLTLAVADRRDRDPRRRCHQRLGDRDLEPAGEPGYHPCHAHGRSYEHVRARPAVRAAAACPPWQGSGARPRPDRHHVQLAELALRQPLRGYAAGSSSTWRNTSARRSPPPT